MNTMKTKEKLKDLADEILTSENNFRDKSVFWFSTHVTESAAKKKARLLNDLILRSSGAKAGYQLDVNYGGRGFGVYIKNFSQESGIKLAKKFKIKE